ncbi:MAG: GvpL/GvpF family gas vesicle protein, partial [Pseudomonadota bacterium]
FGGTLTSCQELSHVLRDNGTAFEAMLRRVDGCLEYVLQASEVVPWAGNANARVPLRGASASGSAVVRHKTGEGTEISSTLQSLVGAAVPFVREMQQLAHGSGQERLHLAMLVPHENACQFTAIAGSYKDRLWELGIDFSLRGPWPPYSFTYPNTIKPLCCASPAARG